MSKFRNYKAEYQRRIEKGLASGKSRSAARGHSRAEDLGPLAPQKLNRDSVYEKALKSVKRGGTLKSASKYFGISQDKLRRYIKRSTTAQFQNGKWVIFDSRPQPIWFPVNGNLKEVTVAFDDTSDVGKYWAGVNKFLETNDAEYLFPFEGEGILDVHGKYFPFETRPNVLRKLDSIGELNFVEIYADVAK